MSTSPISSFQLKNGLSLLCLDHSKKIADDLWYICVWVRMIIPVDKKWFGNYPVNEKKFQQISSALGKEIIFKQKKERHFVSGDQKEQIIKEICDSAVELGMKYFTHDDFAAKYILKVFTNQQRCR